jgi:hypothetical protein
MASCSARLVLQVVFFLAAGVCGGCGGARLPATAPVYRVAPTHADLAGPVVSPIYMHMVGAEAALERAADVGWVRVCDSPCEGYVPASGTYRVAVPDEHSAPFTMPGSPGTGVTLKVDDDATVWTRDSDQVAAARAREDAAGFHWHRVWAYGP